MILRPLPALAIALAGACDRGGERAQPGPSPAESAPAIAPAAPPSAGTPAPATSAVPAVATTDAGRAAPVGGPWQHCADGFRATSNARRDLLRLTTLCGPSNGQKRVGTTVEGEAGQPVEAKVDVEEGACVRVFAAGDADVGEMHLELVAPDGAVLASADAAGRFGVLRDDRPICAATKGTYVARVRARGAGKIALETWVLP